MTTERPTEREQFFARLAALAGMIPHFTLTKEMVAMYDRLLRDLGYPTLCRALERIMAERNSRDPFPAIKEIRNLIQPVVSDEDQAMVTADLIIQAVRRDGWVNPDRAKIRMGEVGWAVVGGAAGYQALCSNLDGKNENSYRRQFSELARAYAIRGLPPAEERPALTGPTSGPGLTGFGDLMNKLVPPEGHGKEEP